MVFKYIIQLFIYITSLLCPYDIESKSIDHGNSKRNETIERMKPKSVTFSQIHNESYKYYNDEDKEIAKRSLKKSNSYSIQHYYCGNCSNIIEMPRYMYSDKPYCSVQCRTKQIDRDNTTQNREHHSFSV